MSRHLNSRRITVPDIRARKGAQKIVCLTAYTAVLAEAQESDQAGAFAIVVEGVAPDLADEITQKVAAPTIGIGASPNCDGQILVTDDMIGLFDWTPKFVRRYGNLRNLVSQAVEGYAADVRSGEFPGDAELYTLKTA
jgi:3-methyl-2-oxobutanoate hydroxymethyltransferase